MATLTFNCPNCQKQYNRVKPEMVGYRVKCSCGTEFRLGSKKDRQPGIDKQIIAKRQQKNRRDANP